MGKTHGVIRDVNPRRKARTIYPTRESLLEDASPSRIEGSRMGPVVPRTEGDVPGFRERATLSFKVAGFSVASCSTVFGTSSFLVSMIFSGGGTFAVPLTGMFSKEKSSSKEMQLPSISVHTCPSIDPETLRDRKSTRLNSSHLVISYAGFCL